MTWVKIDDQFQDHPKFLDVSLAGIGLWTAGLAYCSRYLTDGLIVTSAARRLGATSKLTAELVAAGLWEAVDGGWLIHDYTDYNPPATRVRDTREKRRTSGHKGGIARAKQLASGSPAPSQATGKQSAKQLARPLSSPRPVSHNGMGEILTSSSKGVQGDDDDGKLPAAVAAIDLLAARDLAERQTAPKPDLEPVHDVDAWLDRARGRRWAQLGERVDALAADGLDATAIVEALCPAADPPVPHLAVVPPTVEELAARPLCECGMPAGHPAGCAEPWQALP